MFIDGQSKIVLISVHLNPREKDTCQKRFSKCHVYHIERKEKVGISQYLSSQHLSHPVTLPSLGPIKIAV